MKRAKICAGTFVTCQMKVPLKGPRGNFVREKVDVIVAFENQTVRAAKAATSEVPILFLHVLTDPVGEGFVQSLAHPGGNITGIFGDVPGKRVELLKEVVPNLDRLLLLFDPTDHTALQELTALRAAATALKLRLVERAAVTQGEDRKSTRLNSSHRCNSY